VRLLLLLIVLVCSVLPVPRDADAVDWIEFSGYVKSFAVVFDPPEVENDPEPTSATWANNNRVRSNVAVFLADWIELDVSYDLSLRFQDEALVESNPFFVFREFSIYRVSDLERVLLPRDPAEDEQVLLLQNLDRLFFTLRASWCDLYIGRQAIAWGSAHAINPTDIIAPFLYTEIDTEDRTGVDAARLRMPAGSLGEIDLGYVAGEDFEWEESAAYARGRFSAARTDIALIGMIFRENVMAGLDATRALGGAGTWCEAAYVWANDDALAAGQPPEEDYLRLSAGADYNFGSGVYVFAEYHYNGAGASDPSRYLENIVNSPTAYLEGAVYLLGRHYIIPGLSWQATPLTTVSAEIFSDLNDGSLLFSPYVEYNVSENLYLSAGGYVAIGPGPVYDPMPVFQSEFGTYPNQYYAFFRYYF